ncbi:hypothetical protein AADZ90_006355 [Aestuariibius sp. 2305UL40-4]|uniref:hypothetical protein n=1 Tax=Aestuariibius violaceus TaxID=3234132 RepID=UPI00345E923A
MLGFLFGRIFAQSEAILAEKRRVYEAFLVDGPAPNDADSEWSEDIDRERQTQIKRVVNPMLLYASPPVAQAVSVYLEKFHEADAELGPSSPALHPTYVELAKSHNDVALEMSRDALGWSVFGYRGKSRVPSLLKK